MSPAIKKVLAHVKPVHKARAEAVRQAGQSENS